MNYIDKIIPKHEQIKQARVYYGVDRARAAFIVNVSQIDWDNWESGLQIMPAGTWDEFLLKTKQGKYERLRHER